ncbi:Acyltransferase LovD [Purpureocillium lavendulum]|uniref:Acyltransferase LovD n=1 Tax=Purpureocillium lavendulum TaxID=1247861 RepID=A0AB34FG28_9HYPO|nr:Acyltransferase LovD [Purpureocillium lavendulum]
MVAAPSSAILAPSPARQPDSAQPDDTARPQIASRPPSITGKGKASAPSSSAAAAAAAAAPSGSAAPARAPLPTRQPKSSVSAKAAPAAPGPLPRLSLPPVDKMAMTAVISPSPAPEAPTPKTSMTSKEWVIPPRPKPGRKPATDTPPTKRKAQNRAAQRAFRERRAARVGELEIQLDEQREGYEKTEADLKEKIHGLELDLQSFRSRCMLLENMLDRERQERIRAETQAETLRRRHADDFFRPQSMSASHRHSRSQQPSPTRQHQRHSMSDGHHMHHGGRNFSISQIITPPETADASSSDADVALTCGNCSPSGPCACADEVLASAASGCGKCGFGTRCECLDEITASVTQGQGQALKRPVSPSNPSSNGKRQRSDARNVLETETDFTAMFSRPSAANPPQPSPYELHTESQMSSTDSMPFKDSCGFCKDGTYCMCAEEAAAMATPAMTPTAETLPPISQQTQTPPPSEPDIIASPLVMEMTADGAVKLPRRTQQPHKKPTKSNTKGCGANGPGTCAQCQADPKSGLFCRLMAAKFDRESGKAGGGCCGGKGAGGGCCKSGGPESQKITLPSLPSLGLSCAEAYQTLSSHRNFDRAADDISSWLPKLKASTPTPGRPGSAVPRGRQAIEVEAASIMSVLKEFDVRFGREC